MASLLLVDDRPHNLIALRAILEPLGHDLVSAESGAEALRILLHRDDFAVILLDVQMPEMDGFEVAEVIKKRERTSTIPIIFLTALSKDDEHVFRGYEVGAVDYVVKPLEPDLLRLKVGVFVELWEKNLQIRQRDALLAAQELAEVRRVSTARYRQLADAMPQIVWTADSKGSATYFNQRWFDYTGMTEDEADDAWSRVTHPDDVALANANREQALTDSSVFEVEYRFRAADGTYRWHLGRAVPIAHADGSVDFWIGTATDIDDRKRIEEAQHFLLDAGTELSRSLDWRAGLAAVARLAVPRIADWCAIHVAEEDGTISTLALEHCNPAKAGLAKELRERHPASSDHVTGAAAAIRDSRSRLLADLEPAAVASFATDKPHARLLEELGLRSFICVPIAGRGRTLGAITLVTGESGRRFGESDLRTAEQFALRAASVIENAQLYEEVEHRARAARALETIADGVVLLDQDELVLLWNHAAQTMTGIAEGDALGRHAREVLPGYDDNIVSVAVDGRPQTVPVDLGDRELWLSFSAVRFDAGTVYAFRDLTEERALEQMRSDFIATVSHELRTPLAAIYGAAVTLRRVDIDLDEAMRSRLLDVVADEADRLAEIVNDVLLASHLDSGQLQLHIETVDAAQVTESVVETAKTHLPDGVTICMQASVALPAVSADPQQLRQVLANLVDNAVKYSPGAAPSRSTCRRRRAASAGPSPTRGSASPPPSGCASSRSSIASTRT